MEAGVTALPVHARLKGRKLPSDFLGREAKADGIESLTAEPYTVHSTINATLQRDTKAALQEVILLKNRSSKFLAR
jgi:hypothetical protein